MKLIHYTIRNLSVPLLLILTVWAACFYFAILYEVNDETNDTLENYKEIVLRSILQDESLLKDHSELMNRYFITEVPEEEARVDEDFFYDAVTYIAIEDEYEPVRVLKTYFQASNGKFYELRLEMSTLEKDDMQETYFWGVLILFLLLICCTLITVHFVFKKSFKPLYRMVDWLKRFQFGRKIEPLVNETEVDEFKTLNTALQHTLKRNTELYDQQKEFIENASHEMQTPLAVCMNKLELISNNPYYTEEQLEEIADLYRGLSHISKLNKSLLLLTRIENKQYSDKQLIPINELVREKLSDLSELYAHKNLTVGTEEQDKLQYEMNEHLASILFTNLIKNAFIHTPAGGHIKVGLIRSAFTISNTGNNGKLDEKSLFERFNRQNNQKESTGLGLAIVRSITTMYSLAISYRYDETAGVHVFTIRF